MSTLEVKNLTKRFGSLVAVRDVSMTVAKGELRAVIGPNGAGKTTFFNLVSGFFAPTAGSILFEGRDVAAFSPHERVGLGMARTFQITEIFPELTVFENVRIATEVAAGYRLRPWLSRADTAELRRRVEETLALALKPRLLLLDEPTAGMGDQETYEITQLVRQLHKDGNLTIVLIEHDMRVVFHLADRITVLDQGSFLAEGTPQEIATNEAVQTAYLGKAA